VVVIFQFSCLGPLPHLGVELGFSLAHGMLAMSDGELLT